MSLRKISTVGLAVGVVLLFFGVAFSQSNLYTFPGPDEEVGQGEGGRHSLGGRGDTIYVLRQFGHTYCHKSIDGGRTFGLGVRVNSTFGSASASLCVDTTGLVYIAYQDFADIYFSKSTDGGQTFTPGVKVNDDTIPETGQEIPIVTVNNRGQIFITWSDQRNMVGGGRTVFAAATYDGGLSFTPNVQVNDSGTRAGLYDIVADDAGRVYVGYSGEIGGRIGLIVARSVDSGQSFTHRTFADDPPWLGGPSSIAISGPLIGVTWGGLLPDSISNRYSLRFSISADYGQIFLPSAVVDSNSPNVLPAPSLVWKNDIFYVAWRSVHRRTPSGPYFDHIWFSYSRDSGKSFVPFIDAIPDDTNSGAHISPSLWINGMEKAVVTWTDDRWDPFFQSIWYEYVSVGKPNVTKGDLDFDGLITLKDIVLEINAIFVGEPFPAPSHRADVNCDGKLSGADLVTLIYRHFTDLPFPCG